MVVYGQAWGSEKLLERAVERSLPYWHIDNGYWKPGRGRPDGYYRICYRSMKPRYVSTSPPQRAEALGIKLQLQPWRKTGSHVLLALPGHDYGQGLGWDMPAWILHARKELPRYTDRPIVVRPRQTDVPLEFHLRDCWAVVTHSSNIAVDAVTAGIPVFVAATSPSAPVGNLDWDRLENPHMPEREPWMRSLACQQFTPAEMADGTAYGHLSVICRNSQP